MKDRPMETVVSLCVIAAGLVVSAIAVFLLFWHWQAYQSLYGGPDAPLYEDGRIEVAPGVSLEKPKSSFIAPFVFSGGLLVAALGISVWEARRLRRRLNRRKLW